MAVARQPEIDDDAILSVQGLRVDYHSRRATVHAVDGVDLEVRANEVFGLAGESGSGKSTLALAILRLLRPPGQIVGGSVRFLGEDLLELSERYFRTLRWRHFAYIPQGSMSALNPVMRLREQFADTLAAHGAHISPAERGARFAEALRGVGLEADILPRYPHELSGGMRQRVCIALALLLGAAPAHRRRADQRPGCHLAARRAGDAGRSAPGYRRLYAAHRPRYGPVGPGNRPPGHHVQRPSGGDEPHERYLRQTATPLYAPPHRRHSRSGRPAAAARRIVGRSAALVAGCAADRDDAGAFRPPMAGESQG